MNRVAIIGCPCRDEEELAAEAIAICVWIFAECHAGEALALSGSARSVRIFVDLGLTLAPTALQ